MKDMCFEWNFGEFITFAEFHSKILGFLPITIVHWGIESSSL